MQHSIVRYFTQSGEFKIKWRDDKRCGRGYPLPEISPAECDPDGENPCCSDDWYGECGNTTEHCSCSDCIDYVFVREWRESGGKIQWRNDSKCGSQNSLPDNSPAECDPDGENPCCSGNDWDGKCGNTTEHCSCSDCVDYRVIYRDWRESGGKIKWRNDSKCGSEYPLPDNSPVECDPDGENPCCRYGECGNTTDYCSCSDCVDYSVIYRDWRESGGKRKWRYDGRCGSDYPLPDGSPAECDPDGENSCCSGKLDGVCGNTTEHCSCSDCVDYSVIYRDWRESGGKRKWRYDGRCGSDYPLPDGSPAECDPDGENPCCSDYDWYGECVNTTEHCSYSDCVDYSIVSELRKSGENCTVTRVS